MNFLNSMINLVTLQENLEHLGQNISKETFLFDLLTIYDLPKSTISLLSKNPSKLSGKDDQIILKNKVLFHITTLEEDEHVAIDALQKDKASYKFNPRFIIVTDFVTFLAIDTKTKETLDINIKDLGKYYAFFLPWCGMEKSQHVNENPADIRAAYKMDKLYQAIVADDPEYYNNNSHDLNLFLSRLLFCFFAEDTAIFPRVGMFTDSITSHTHENGEGLDVYFSTLFDVLNAKEDERTKFASHLLEFPYVNGGLFERNIKLPKFTAGSRSLIIECGRLNWDSINPDIFGSMIQAVVHPGQRENLGMHYTSVPNIMKVIEPLFLNDLYEELEGSRNDIKKLTKLRERVSKIKIFDPACGSGNFLIISYKELCKLEIEIIRRQNEIGPGAINYSGVSLNSFYGIEIDDFAHEIARLSLWLAQHQMNQYFDGMFGIMKATLPLRESGKIVCGNATRIDWNEVCPRRDQIVGEYEIYVVGNPPYLGSRNQEDEQKADLKSLFINDYKSLDYISAWFYKGAKYISGYKNIKLAFVSTNSISQGEQVSLLWPRILDQNIEISFAHQSFKWKNLAKGNAGVTVIILGLRNTSTQPKYLFNDNLRKEAKNINAYLFDASNFYIKELAKPISEFKPMMKGNAAIDNSNFLFNTKEEAGIFKTKYPEQAYLVREFIGSEELINSKKRFCLWLKEANQNDIDTNPEIKKRVENIKIWRGKSPKAQTRKYAEKPTLFMEDRQPDSDYLMIPVISSERRDCIPIGFFTKATIANYSSFIIPNATLFEFSVIHSKMHIVWIKAVCGSLETRIRYSSALGYNTFPFPNITPNQKASLASHAYNILEEREKYPEKTLADLYDPDKMPDGLREAHKYLDLAIDQIYRSKPFESNEDRLAHLFKLYEEMTAKETKKIIL
jgi:hypothetical protein